MARMRESVPAPFEGYPAFGAYHEIIPNASVDRFMRGFCEIADEVFKKSWEIEQPLQVLSASDAEPEPIADYDFRKYYRAYYATSMWVSVLDMGDSEKHARAMRTIWERQDLGDTQQIARNEIDRQLPDIEPALNLDQIVRLGRRLPNAPAHHEGRKLALVPNAAESGETIDLLCSENDIVVDAIRKRLKKFVPIGEYMPHMTFAWFTNKVTEEEISTIAARTKVLASEYPVNVALDRYISFRDRLTRKLRV